MECLDKDLTEEQILTRIDGYLNGELSFDEDKTFTDHILECEYCQETLLLYKMMLRVGKEYGDEIFGVPRVTDNAATQNTLDTPQLREEQGFKAHPPFMLLKDNEPIHDIHVTTLRFSWAKELEPPAVYTLLDQDRQILLQERVGGFLTGTLQSPFRAQTKVVPIATEQGGERGKIVIRLEEKENRIILTLETKGN